MKNYVKENKKFCTEYLSKIKQHSWSIALQWLTVLDRLFWGETVGKWKALNSYLNSKSHR